MAMTAEALRDLSPEEFKRAYGAWLQAVREAAGVTQRTLSVALGPTEGTIGRWERGEHLPDILTHLRLLDFFSDTLESHPGLKEWATRVYPPAFAPSLSA